MKKKKRSKFYINSTSDNINKNFEKLQNILLIKIKF